MTGSQQPTFDFSLLPEILRHRLFRGLPPHILEPLGALGLPETTDRLRVASLLFGKVSATQEDWLNRGYLRAALSEFRSVAPALRLDLGHHQGYAPHRSQNPLVHLLLRLRRPAVYVRGTNTTQRTVSASFEIGETRSTTDIQIVLIEDLYNYLRPEVTDWLPSDLSALCQWFDENQATYGASLVLDVGVMLYCLELIDTHPRQV